MDNITNEILKAHREWVERFANATEEEQAIMLKEKQEKALAAAKERDLSIYNERKQRFVAKMNNYIEVAKRVIKARSVALDVLKSFDGKVLNNRYTKAVQDELEKAIGVGIYGNNLAYCTLSFEYEREYSANVGFLNLESKLNGEHISWKLTIILKPSIGGYVHERVDYKATSELSKNSDTQLHVYLKEAKDAIKKYDSILAKAKKLEKAIKDYGKTNYHVRDFIKSNSLLGGLYYL